MTEEKHPDLLRFHNDPQQDLIMGSLRQAIKAAGFGPESKHEPQIGDDSEAAVKKSEMEARIAAHLAEFGVDCLNKKQIRKRKQQLWDEFLQNSPEANSEEKLRFLEEQGMVQKITIEELQRLKDSASDAPAELSTPGVTTFVPGNSERYITSAENAVWASIKPVIKGKADKFRGMLNTTGADFEVSDDEAAAGFQKCLDDIAKMLGLPAGPLKFDACSVEGEKAQITANGTIVPAENFGLYRFEGFHLADTGNKVVRFQHKDYPARKFSLTVDNKNEVVDIKVRLFRYTIDGEDGMTVANANLENKGKFLANVLKTYQGTLKSTFQKDSKTHKRGIPDHTVRLITPEGPQDVDDTPLRLIRIAGPHRSITNVNGTPVIEAGIDIYQSFLSIATAMHNGKLGQNPEVVIWLPKFDYAGEAESFYQFAEQAREICGLPQGSIKYLVMNESWWQALNNAKTACVFGGDYRGLNTGYFDEDADCLIKNYYLGPFNPHATDSDYIGTYETQNTELCHQTGRHFQGYNGKRMNADYQHLPWAMNLEGLDEAKSSDSWVATTTQATASMWSLLFKSKEDLDGDYKRMEAQQFIDDQDHVLQEMVEMRGMLLTTEQRQSASFLRDMLVQCVDKTMQNFDEMFVKNKGGGACGIKDTDGRKKMFDAALLRIQQFTHGWLYWAEKDSESGHAWALSADGMRGVLSAEIENRQGRYPAEVRDATIQILTDSNWFLENRLKTGGCVDDLITDGYKKYEQRLQLQLEGQEEVVLAPMLALVRGSSTPSQLRPQLGAQQKGEQAAPFSQPSLVRMPSMSSSSMFPTPSPQLPPVTEEETSDDDLPDLEPVNNTLSS